jgi:hypothetical protein
MEVEEDYVNLSNRVGVHGIGPCTSFLSGKRSTDELHTHIKLLNEFIAVLSPMSAQS